MPQHQIPQRPTHGPKSPPREQLTDRPAGVAEVGDLDPDVTHLVYRVRPLGGGPARLRPYGAVCRTEHSGSVRQ